MDRSEIRELVLRLMPEVTERQSRYFVTMIDLGGRGAVRQVRPLAPKPFLLFPALSPSPPLANNKQQNQLYSIAAITSS